MKLQKAERIVKRIMEISLALMVVGMFVVVGDMAYRQSTTGTDPELNRWLVGPMVLFVGVSLLCIALMFLFEVITPGPAGGNEAGKSLAGDCDNSVGPVAVGCAVLEV